ncbi:MAG: hypothetical protein J5881_04520 [Clostridia bacterium]|nr:hypothetical protein [Clostridia bacterium]
MIDVKEIKSKFEKNMIDNMERENAQKILIFLANQKCNFIEDIVTDYLDLFAFDYNEFVNKYENLNNKYNGAFLEKTSEDMNLLEEFYYI